MQYDFDTVHDRRGTYCTQWDYIQDRFGVPGILPFSISDTDFLSPQPIVDAVCRVAQSGLYGYTRWNHHDFKGAVASWYERRYGAHVDEDWIVYSPSVMYSVSVLVRLTTESGEGVLTLSPMYDSFPGAIEGNGRRMVSSSLIREDGQAHYQLDMDDLSNKARSCSAFLLCSPHNPTGRMWTEDELLSIADICSANNLYLIADEIHADIQLTERRNRSAVSLGDRWSKVVVASSASKIFNTPALGGSYVIIPDAQLRNEFLQITRHTDYLNSPTLPGLYATMVGYGECDDYADQLSAYIQGNRALIAQWLKENEPKIQMVDAEATYLAWLDVRDLGYSSAALQDALVHIGGVGIMAGETYGADGLGYLRMCIGCPKSKVEEGLKRMGKALHYLEENNHVCQ